MAINLASTYGATSLNATTGDMAATSTVGTAANSTPNTTYTANTTATTALSGEVNGDKKELTKEEVKKMTESLNKFMESLEVNIQFTLHEKTKRLMVQVVDPNDNNKVIKEFPPHELLDTMAKISEYIGVLLDKKA